MKYFTCLVVCLLLCRCASIEKSVGLGVGIGAGTGILTSQLAHYNTKGTVVLGLGGAVLGGVVAALLHKDPPKFSVPPTVSYDLKKNPPPLKGAEQDTLWIPDKIENDRFEEGHRVFLIKKPAHWQLRDSSDEESQEGANNE
jgi:hypothetical protein